MQTQNKKINKIIKEFLNLSKTEIKILDFLIKRKKNYTIKQISKFLKLDRSTVQKSIKKLIELDLILRKKDKIKTGKFKYKYYSNDKNKIKKNIIKRINEYFLEIKETINNW